MTVPRSMLAWDVRLQVRYGFYAVYAVLTAAFVLGLRLLPQTVRTDAAVFLVVTDPTVLGFYFIAAMVLFEKEAGVLDALVVSPLGDRGYLASKAGTLAVLAVAASSLVAVLGHGGITALGLVTLVTGVALSATLFVLVGFVAVARFDSVNEYFISAVGWGTVLFLPLFGYVGVVETPLFYLLPAQPVLVVVDASFRPRPAWKVAYAFAYLLVANGVAYRWACRSFRRHVVRGGDPGSQLGRDRTPGDVTEDRSGASSSRSPVVALFVADLRNWLRDPMLVLAGVGPFFLAALVRFGLPTVQELAAGVIDLQPYLPVIAGSLVAFGPIIYGFVVGMFVLEDRELGVLSAFRASPLSARGYLVYRGATAYALAFVATLPAMAVVSFVDVPILTILLATAVGALGAPIVALVFASLADNTIEGVALSKLVNLVVVVPALVIAVAPEPAQFAAGVFPAYWPVKAYVAAASGDQGWPLFVLAGLLAHLIALAVLGSRFEHRID